MWILSAIKGLSTNAPRVISKTPAAQSNSLRIDWGITTLRVRTSNPIIKSTAECPTPQTVAEVMDFRRLLLLHNKVDTATTWSGSRECAKPNPNPVKRIKIIDKSIGKQAI